jgi:hypothetical protein
VLGLLRMDREQNGNCSSQKFSFRKFQQISNDKRKRLNAFVLTEPATFQVVGNTGFGTEKQNIVRLNHFVRLAETFGISASLIR